MNGNLQGVGQDVVEEDEDEEEEQLS